VSTPRSRRRSTRYLPPSTCCTACSVGKSAAGQGGGAAGRTPPRCDDVPVLVRGVDLEVRDEGEGRLLVWGHGLMAGMQVEDETELLAPRAGGGVRVVRYDARGHGRSAASHTDDDYQWSSL